jgi:hypothetical protein
MKMDTMMRRALLAGASLAVIAGQPVLAQEFERGGVLRIGISQMAPSPDPVVTTFGVLPIARMARHLPSRCATVSNSTQARP